MRRARCCGAFAGGLAVLLSTCAAGWTQDLPREQDHWRTVMGPSVLDVAGEKDKASKPGSEFTECASGCPVMVVVPAGSFIMGSPPDEPDRSDSEGPQHEVAIARAFAVGKTEVTFAQWDTCVAAGACPEVRDSTWGRGDRPVINVTWDEARQYAAWLTRITGKAYGLLTEAEWEYAARAGRQTRFSFGDDEAQLDQYAWFHGNSDRKSQPVGTKKANAFALYDMHGNVFEWVEDAWHDNYEGAPSDGSAWLNDGAPGRRVVRSGSWYFDPPKLRSASRAGPPFDLRDGNVGFRVARALSS
jgi:formylglycine-generating enzyme required for sulfatase activity